MANIKEKLWGFNVILSHNEACALTSGLEAAEFVLRVGQYFTSGLESLALTALQIAVDLAGDQIRKKNEHSGGNGVKLKFLWGVPPIYVGVSRRGDSSEWGSSPCN